MSNRLEAWPFIVIGLVALLFVAGIATNSGDIGMLLGMAAGVGTDPLLIAVAAVIGALNFRAVFAAIAICCATLAFQILVAAINGNAGLMSLAWLGRLIAIAVIAAIISIIVGLVRQSRTRAPQ